MALIVHDIWKTFPHRTHPQTVLRGVDMEVQPGELVALIGHSGCGKSTLLKAIGGLLPTDAGTITLDDLPVDGPGPDRAMVFQQYSLLPRLSLLDNVRHAVRAARRDWTNADADAASERYLTAVGLWPHKDKRPAQVSGGMQQRTAVARAFAVEPRALLLDEPFGALDALTRARLQTQLIDLWKSTSDTEIVVMVTHGIDEAILLSDRIVVMGNPPGPSVIDVIPVDLPRPRDRVSVLDDPHFRQVQARLLELLMREEAVAASSAA
jgi:ABC-type nitrate/sulfonate/bicarbonate transport system ATPase subunit